jgi:predicted MFS family arabinose efflux permease
LAAWLFVFGSAVAALAESVAMIAVGRALQGAGAISASVMALAADLTAEEQRTKAMAVIGISIGLSFALALVCGPLLAAWGGLAAVFWTTAALGLIGMAIVAFGVPSGRARAHEDIGAQRGMFGPVLRDPVLQRLNGSVFLLHFTLTASFLVVPAVIESGLGVPRDDHWKVYLPVLLLSLLGMYPFLHVSERKGQPLLALRAGVLLMPVSLADRCSLLEADAWLYVALCGFFSPSTTSRRRCRRWSARRIHPRQGHGAGRLRHLPVPRCLRRRYQRRSGLRRCGPSGLLWLCLGAIGLWLLLIWQLPQRDAVPAPA